MIIHEHFHLPKLQALRSLNPATFVIAVAVRDIRQIGSLAEIELSACSFFKHMQNHDQHIILGQSVIPVFTCEAAAPSSPARSS
jgi:hypothetical protein